MTHRLVRSTAATLMAVLASVTLVAGVGTRPARATSARASLTSAPAFNPNDLMSNSVFEDTLTMTVTQIQAFLNRFPSSCLRNYQGLNPLSYSTYSATNVSAAQVISSSSRLWGVNPQVLLATIEKEQRLVTGGGGCDVWRYWSAMGYNCPEGSARYSYPALGITNTCVARQVDAGFSAQVNHAAWQLQFNRQRADGNINWNGSGNTLNYGFNTSGYRRRNVGAALVYYDGIYAIDRQSVTMTNGTTASLYTYTPHVSANLTFVTLFTNWFGSTHAVNVDYTAYVSGVYRVLLTRSADTAGLAFWANYLSSGGTPAAFVNSIVTGSEYTVNTVEADYRLLLKRAGDKAGVAYWANQLAVGRRNDRILANLAGSDEYFGARSSRDARTFVSNLYIGLLGRSTDGGGLTYWSGRITAGTISRYDFGLTLADSPEYARSLVNSVYKLVLGRDADSAGQKYWTGHYVQTQDILQLVVSLSTSAEGKTHLALLG